MKNVTQVAIATFILSTSINASAKIIYERSKFGMEIICAGVKIKGIHQFVLKNNGRVFADRVEMQLPCEVTTSKPAFQENVKLFCPRGSSQPIAPLHGNEIIYIKNESGKILFFDPASGFITSTLSVSVPRTTECEILPFRYRSDDGPSQNGNVC